MKYVIDEEELIKFVQSYYFSSDKNMAKDIAKDFLKSKEPIELIFEGSYLLDEPEGTFENPEFWEAMENISESDTKKFKIFIQKEKP